MNHIYRRHAEIFILRSGCGCFSSHYHNVYIGHAVAKWIRHYATSRKVAGSRSDEVEGNSSIYLFLPAALGPGVYSASNINEYQKQEKNVSGE
jgi:hypothetical protein